MKPMNKDGSQNKEYTFVTVVKDYSKEEPKMEVIPLNVSD